MVMFDGKVGLFLLLASISSLVVILLLSQRVDSAGSFFINSLVKLILSITFSIADPTI
ncbi:hypothetical protein BML2526_01270 [Providencia rettgeri]|nr:hypothetical protein BML2526_01270 [Providencia rettgeri]BBV13444.1 hypothetical protein BML2576_29030 [Providencia rettgeri]BDH19548.1 hypothetical protein PrNR1418_28390 [Providencia rettgeri]